MRNTKHIISFVLVIVLLCSSIAFAAAPINGEIQNVGIPTISVIGSTAKCSAKVAFVGQSIDATLELWQGDTLVASWNNTGTGSVTVSGSATIIHGLTYTLTVSGTANGVSFTPQSITRTL